MGPRTKKFQRKAKLTIRDIVLLIVQKQPQIDELQRLLAKTPAERNNFVSDNKLSFNCLSKGH